MNNKSMKILLLLTITIVLSIFFSTSVKADIPVFVSSNLVNNHNYYNETLININWSNPDCANVNIRLNIFDFASNFIDYQQHSGSCNTQFDLTTFPLLSKFNNNLLYLFSTDSSWNMVDFASPVDTFVYYFEPQNTTICLSHNCSTTSYDYTEIQLAQDIEIGSRITPSYNITMFGITKYVGNTATHCVLTNSTFGILAEGNYVGNSYDCELFPKINLTENVEYIAFVDSYGATFNLPRQTDGTDSGTFDNIFWNFGCYGLSGFTNYTNTECADINAYAINRVIFDYTPTSTPSPPLNNISVVLNSPFNNNDSIINYPVNFTGISGVNNTFNCDIYLNNVLDSSVSTTNNTMYSTNTIIFNSGLNNVSVTCQDSISTATSNTSTYLYIPVIPPTPPQNTLNPVDTNLLIQVTISFMLMVIIGGLAFIFFNGESMNQVTKYISYVVIMFIAILMLTLLAVL